MTRHPFPEQPPSAANPGGQWKHVWDSKNLSSGGSTLARLLAADGYDTQFAALDERSWVEFVHRRATDLGITGERSVFEVGCGAGAFLYELHREGCAVAGIDWSANLVSIARAAMPGCEFGVKEAADLDTQPPADVVVSCGVFTYFPSLEYASGVIERMVAKATHAVAVFDVPDHARKDAALEYRRASIGPEEYAQRYAGLEHCYYDRAWIADALSACGLLRVQTHDQDLANYGNAPFRFNVWGYKPDRANAEG